MSIRTSIPYAQTSDELDYRCMVHDGVGYNDFGAGAPIYLVQSNAAMGAFILRDSGRRGRCDYRHGVHGHAGGKHRADGNIAALGSPSPFRTLGGDRLLCAFLLRCRTIMAGLDGMRSAGARYDPELHHGTEPVFQGNHQPQACGDFWR